MNLFASSSSFVRRFLVFIQNPFIRPQQSSNKLFRFLPLRRNPGISQPVSELKPHQIPKLAEMLLLQQDQKLNRFVETSRYVSKGFEKPVGYWLLSTFE